jgi:hypothetical protein
MQVRDKHCAVSLRDEVKALADKEGKTSVVVLCEKNRPRFWLLVRSDDFCKL